MGNIIEKKQRILLTNYNFILKIEIIARYFGKRFTYSA
jgi:hypothetical protein